MFKSFERHQIGTNGSYTEIGFHTKRDSIFVGTDPNGDAFFCSKHPISLNQRSEQVGFDSTKLGFYNFFTQIP